MSNHVLQFDGSADIQEIVQSLKDAKRNFEIQTICFTQVELDVAIVKALVDLLRSTSNREFHAVQLKECTSSSSKLCTLVSILMLLENVKGISLKSIDLPSKVMETLGACLVGNCMTPSLGLDVPISQTVISIIARGIEKNTHLKILDLSGCFMDMQALVTIGEALKMNSGIVALKLANCDLVDEQIEYLAHNTLESHMSLKELNLKGNRCRSGGLNAIARLLQSKVNKLESLVVSYQGVSSGDKFGILPLATSLGNNNHLKFLDISNNSPVDAEDKVWDVIRVCEALRENCTLLHLDISANNIGDADLVQIMNILCQNSTLQILDLQNNNITNEGMAEFAKLVGGIKGLKKIFLCGNKFGIAGIRFLLDSLPATMEHDFF